MFGKTLPGSTYNESEVRATNSGDATTIVAIIGGARKGPTTLTEIRNQYELEKTFGAETKADWGVRSAKYILNDTSRVLYRRVVGTDASLGVAKDTLNDYVQFKTRTYDDTMNGAVIRLDLIKQSEEEKTAEEPRKVTVSIILNGNTLETFTGLTLDDDPNTGLCVVISKQSEYVIAEWGTKPIQDYINNNDAVSEETITYNKGDLYPYQGFFYECLQEDTSKSETDREPTNISDTGYWEKIAKAYFAGDKYVMTGTSFLCLSEDRAKDLENEEPMNLRNEAFWRQSKATDIEYDRTWMVSIANGNSGISSLKDTEIAEALSDVSNPNNLNVHIIITPGWSSKVILNKAKEVCNNRGDAMYIPEIPDGLDPQEAVNYVEGKASYFTNGQMDSQFFAVYYPWVGFRSAEDSTQIEYFPASTVACRQWCYNDRVAGQWFAPAGKQETNPRGFIKDAVDTRVFINTDTQELLYNHSCINPILNYIGEGPTLYGNKTCKRTPASADKESLFASISTRRLCNYIRKEVTKISRSGVFDPNDSFTHEQWTLKVETLLTRLQNQRGIEKYAVEMGADPSNIKAMVGFIKIKPIFSAEEIVINFQCTDDDLIFGDSEEE